MPIRRLPFIALALCALPAFASEIEFTPAEIAAWPQREFDGTVSYRFVENGQPAVEAIAEDGATALYR